MLTLLAGGQYRLVSGSFSSFFASKDTVSDHQICFEPDDYEKASSSNLPINFIKNFCFDLECLNALFF